MGYDAIALKSGWDEYGIAYGRPTTDVHIRDVRLQSSMGSALAFGSEMSGGISSVLVEHVNIQDSLIGVELKTLKGRGGYITDVLMSDVEFANVQLAIKATGQSGSHPDDKYDRKALPIVKGITFKDMTGTNITAAGNFTGIVEAPFTLICLSNISFSKSSHSSLLWVCSNVTGSSEDVSPEPCPELQSYSSACPSLSHWNNLVASS